MEFVDILQASMEKKKQQDFIKDIEAKIKNPFHPKIDPKRPYRGAKDGDVTIVLYSNYGCPYCKTGQCHHRPADGQGPQKSQNVC